MSDTSETIGEFVERFPWPERLLAAGTPMEWLWHFEVAATPAQVWSYLVETSRLNRALGMSRMEFDEVDGVLHGRCKHGGVKHDWVEEPWEWVRGRYLCYVRNYSRGIGHFLRVVYSLEPSATGTKASVYLGWIPRSAFGKLWIKLGMKQYEVGYTGLFEEIGKSVASGADLDSYTQTAEALADSASQRVEKLQKQLIAQKMPEKALAKLVEHIRAGDQMELYRIQIRRKAHEWGCDESDLLRVCLHATRVGLLDMSWDVICPHCRGVREELINLGEVADRGDCDACEIDFTTDAGEAIEITFHVHPSIREVAKVYYCSAEASSKDHIQLQQTLGAGEKRAVESRMAPGRYRLRTHGEKDYEFLDVAAQDEVVRLENSSSEERRLIVEDVEWKDEALRPTHLFNFQEFRDLFGEEYVGTDIRLNVGEQTIMFTDMVGSTKFYAEHGDPEAFMTVKEHFVKVYDIVKRNHGAVVKTIGDAAMASFSDPVDAVRTCVEIHDYFQNTTESPVRLRASLNTGPCIAVKLNSNIDYFGGTVNVAAKLQAVAEAGEISMPLATYDAPGVAEYLAERGGVIEELTFEPKALPSKIAVRRWSADGRE